MSKDSKVNPKASKTETQVSHDKGADRFIELFRNIVKIQKDGVRSGSRDTNHTSSVASSGSSIKKDLTLFPP